MPVWCGEAAGDQWGKTLPLIRVLRYAEFRWVVPSCSNRVESAAWSRRELVLIALTAYSKKRTERVFRVTVGHEGGVPSVKLR